MFSPEDQQIEICLLKSSLGDIENELVVQRSALPALDAENEMRYRETMNALRVSRSLNSEIERFKQDNMRLTARRMQLKQQSENITAELQRTKETRAQLLTDLKKEEKDIEVEIKKYEDCLKEKAERLRNTKIYYNEEEMTNVMTKTNSSIFELQSKKEKLQNHVDELKEILDTLEPVPEDLLAILGKVEIDEKLKTLKDEYDSLQQRKNELLKYITK